MLILTGHDAGDGGLALEASFGSPRQPRAALADLPLGDELRHRAELVTTELATNALLHGAPPYLFRARYGNGHLHIEVEDSSSQLPEVTPVTTMRGRGLRIVDALSTRWGACPQGRGKVVWADLV